MYDVGLRSQPDDAIFAYARTYHMTMITFDTDYLNQAAFQPPHAGIIILRSLVLAVCPQRIQVIKWLITHVGQYRARLVPYVPCPAVA